MIPQPPGSGDPPHLATIDRLLHQLADGDREAFNTLLPLVYDELHHLAGQHRRRWSGDETLNTTAIVHEAYLRLAGTSEPGWRSQPHFMAVASRAMRHILLDNARQRQRRKRGGNLERVPWHEVEAALNGGGDAADARADALIAVDDALRRLEERDARQSRIVECRFFGGMSIEETGDALGISPATVKRGWAMARAWLHRELTLTLETG